MTKNKKAALSARKGDHLANRVVEQVSDNTDLEQLLRTASRKNGTGYSDWRYRERVINYVFDQYNSFVAWSAFSEEEKTNKLYSRQKAVWLGYRKIYEEAGSDVKLWAFNPSQRRLL